MSVQTGISRDPSDYRLSIHAGQQRAHRDIPMAAIASAIESGEVRNTQERHRKLFVDAFPGDDRAVGVAADVETGEITTVMWRETEPCRGFGD